MKLFHKYSFHNDDNMMTMSMIHEVTVTIHDVQHQ